MNRLEVINGILHVAAASAYGYICYKEQALDIYALLSLSMLGIGVCYIKQHLKNCKIKRDDDFA